MGNGEHVINKLKCILKRGYCIVFTKCVVKWLMSFENELVLISIIKGA